MLYTILLLFNPLAPTYVSWVFAIRQISVHFIFLGFVGLVLVDPKHLDKYLTIWFILSILTTLNGFRQQMFFLPSEIEWLEAGAKKQHILWGKLRVFSNMFDAGQFGPAQGHVMVSAAILTLHSKEFNKRLFYGIAAILGFVGLMISGTRGSLAVPIFGFLAYFIISKNWRILSIGFVALIAAFIFLKYTTIGSNFYAIHRMRTAVNPTEDASFSVRLMNQQILWEYLKDKPFGVGIGTTDNVGNKYNPNHFVASIPTDSYFVKIWVQTGIVGVIFIIIILLYVLFRGGAIIWKIKDDELRHKLIALYSPLLGIFVASYGNNVLPQLPTNIIVFISIAFIFGMERYIKNQNKEIENGQESYSR
jgi:cell division protein FtsW (lipid II flippase)